MVSTAVSAREKELQVLAALFQEGLANQPSFQDRAMRDVRAVHSPVEGAPQPHSWMQNRKTPLDRKVWTGHFRMPSLEGAVAAKRHDHYSWL